MATESVRIAGLDDLFISAYKHEDPARAALAAENVLLPINRGIHAIGELLALADSIDPTHGGIKPSTVAAIGYLISELADLSQICENLTHTEQIQGALTQALAEEKATGSLQ